MNKELNCKHLLVVINLWVRLITARKRSLGQGNIFRSVCQEFCPWGVCLRACWDTTPSPPGPGRHAPGQAGTLPPRSRACWEIRPTSVRYASYWNAILLFRIFELQIYCDSDRKIQLRKYKTLQNVCQRDCHIITVCLVFQCIIV